MKSKVKLSIYSIIKFNLGGDFEHLKKILTPFQEITLNTLNLNYNKINEEGRDKLNSWINGENKFLKILKVNLYNNELPNPQGNEESPHVIVMKT